MTGEAALQLFYADATDKDAERLDISALVVAFTRDLLQLMIQWSEFAEHEVEAWPRTDKLGMTERTRQLLQRLADEQPILATTRPPTRDASRVRPRRSR